MFGESKKKIMSLDNYSHVVVRIFLCSARNSDLRPFLRLMPSSFSQKDWRAQTDVYGRSERDS